MNKKYVKVYHPIRRNRDDKGRILTYSVQMELPGGIAYWCEFNTLSKARKVACYGLKDKKTGIIDYL